MNSYEHVTMCVKIVFYNNSTNSCTPIGLFLWSISGQTHESIINVMRQQARENNLPDCYCKKTNVCQFFMPLTCYREWLILS